MIFKNIISDQLLCSQVLGYASLSRAMFADMQWDCHKTKDEYKEVVRVATRYRKELHHSKEELKGASEVVSSCR